MLPKYIQSQSRTDDVWLSGRSLLFQLVNFCFCSNLFTVWKSNAIDESFIQDTGAPPLAISEQFVRLCIFFSTFQRMKALIKSNTIIDHSVFTISVDHCLNLYIIICCMFDVFFVLCYVAGKKKKPLFTLNPEIKSIVWIG